MPRQVEGQLLGVCVEQEERRRHRREDAGKEDRDLENGPKGELVLHPNAVGCCKIPDASDEEQQPLLQADRPASRSEAPVLAACHDHQHDQAKQREVALPFDVERLVLHDLLEGVDRI